MELEKENKEQLARIAASAVLLAVAVAIEHATQLPLWALLLIYLVPYLVAGADVLKEAAEKLVHGELLDEDFLMSIATIGALAIGFIPGAEHQMPEAVFVMLFFLVGELFEDIASDNSRRSISSLMNLRPDVVHVLHDGKETEADPAEVKVDEIMVIKPGERIALDGVVVEGTSTLDTVALTGESVPRSVTEGQEVWSGCVNLSGLLTVRATKPLEQSTAQRILDLVENAEQGKSRSEAFITRFAHVYTPIVVAAAVILAIVPPVLLPGGFETNFATWLYRALMFLIVSCPCALVVSVPLAFFAGIGASSRRGILVKGSNHIEALAGVHTVVFDKTGTLTEGTFSVTAVHPEKLDERGLLHLAAHVESHSTHPIAVSLIQAWNDSLDCCQVTDVEEIAGKGVTAKVDGKTVAVGNSALMDAVGAKWNDCDGHPEGTIVHVAIDGEYAGHIVISDTVKADAANAMTQLKKNGVDRTVMLTGDRKPVAAAVASKLGVDEYHAELLPQDKVAQVERLISESKPRLAMVGDGINDAPVLARADVGIAMGAMGSDAAIEAADVVLMDDKPSKIAQAIAIAKRTLGIARQNVVFSIGIKLIVLLLATFGLANLWMAVFADVGVTVLAILNAMRALSIPKSIAD